MAALTGRRVVVTRAAEQAGALADILRERGALPVVVPLVEIAEHADGVQQLAALDPAGFHWLVFTSANAARAYLGMHRAVPTNVAAVGTATADILRRAGVAVSLVPSPQRADALVAAFPAGPGRVLVVQAAEGEAVLADGLVGKGWSVTVVTPYHSVPRVPSEEQRAAALSADAVLFTSGSAARAWVAVFGALAPPLVVAIGPQTAAAVARAGLKVSSTAADHSLAGLVAALESLLA